MKKANNKIKQSKMTLEKLATLTQRGFLELDEKFATKDDLKKFATKDDLEKFVTKEELKKELKKFATKEELYFALDKTKDEIKQEIKEEARGGMNKFLTEADKISKKLDTLLQEKEMGMALYQRHDKKLEEHETRITALEK